MEKKIVLINSIIMSTSLSMKIVQFMFRMRKIIVLMKWLKDAKEGIIVAGGQGQGNSLKQLSCPHRIIANQLDNLYVADAGNHRMICWLKGAEGGNGQ
jgi:hypothetical protein